MHAALPQEQRGQLEAAAAGAEQTEARLRPKAAAAEASCRGFSDSVRLHLAVVEAQTGSRSQILIFGVQKAHASGSTRPLARAH